MVKLKCVSKFRPNEPIQFPLIGDVVFNSEGVIEVDESLVESFLKIKCGFDFELIDERSESEKEAARKKMLADETVEEKNIREEKEKILEEKKVYATELKKLHINELNALIATYPFNETQALKKATQKIAYLVNKQYSEE